MSAFNLPPGVSLRDIDPPSRFDSLGAAVDAMDITQIEEILTEAGVEIIGDETAKELRQLLVEQVDSGNVSEEEIL